MNAQTQRNVTHILLIVGAVATTVGTYVQGHGASITDPAVIIGGVFQAVLAVTTLLRQFGTSEGNSGQGAQ